MLKRAITTAFIFLLFTLSLMQPKPAFSMTGGPDYYGYQWDDSQPFSWIDATVAAGGVSAGLSNDSSCTTSVPIPFPPDFQFKFYENTYNSVYISRNGYLTFSNYIYISCDIDPTSHTQREPNNLIAPYWVPLTFDTGSSVTYMNGGSAPNRYFVVEWNQMIGKTSVGTGFGPFTFQAILYENGDIVFQYNSMAPGGALPTFTGIQDIRGFDYLKYTLPASPNNQAVRFNRPTLPTGRVLVYPSNYGAFGSPGNKASFTIPLTNIGDAGSDVFDLAPTCSWPVTLLDGTTKAPLRDTNNNSTIDSGLVAQGATKTLLVQIEVPAIGDVGLNTTCTLQVIPANNTAKSRTAQLRAAIPAPFAEADSVNSDNKLYLSLYEATSQVSLSYANGSTSDGVPVEPSVIETTNGNLVYAWTIGTNFVNCGRPDSRIKEIFYTVSSKTGATLKNVTRLDDNLASLCPRGDPNLPNLKVEINDLLPALAAAPAPDGTIAIAYYREIVITDQSSSKYQYNLFLARLDPAGNLLSVTPLTANSGFYSKIDSQFVEISTPAIAATSDKRFIIAWRNLSNPAASLSDIYAGAWDTAGNLVQGIGANPKQLTNDTPGETTAFITPNLAARDNHAVLVYQGTAAGGGSDIYYQAYDSSLNQEKAETNLTGAVPDSVRNPDVAALSDGRFLAAWETDRIQYAVLDASPNYTMIGSVQTLDTVNGGIEGKVSLAADQGGHAILSWGDYTNSKNIFYALATSAGQTITNPMQLKNSTNGYIIGTRGQNITSHQVAAPSTAGVDLYLSGPTNVHIGPGATSYIQVQLGNLGGTTATNVTITLTYPNTLVLGTLYPNASCSPDSNGTTFTCTWTSPDLGFQGSGVLTIPVSMGTNSIHQTFLLDLNIAGNPQPDGIPGNNHLLITITADPYLRYLPFSTKH